MTKKNIEQTTILAEETLAVQCDSPVSFLYASKDDTELKNYVGTLIGEGGLGTVYLVQEYKTDTTSVITKDSSLVLKVLSKPINNIRKELFIQNAEDAYQKRFDLKTYVSIRGRGVVLIGDSKEEYPALLMDYGGVDLEKAGKSLKKVQKNVTTAFQYKTLLTLISSLRETCAKDISHQDLSPNNILSGFDPDTEDILVLEKNIIEGRVCLTDRARNELASAFSINASVAQNLQFKMYFFSGAELATPQDRDMYSFFANSAWLLSGKRGETPEAHALRVYGISTKLSADGRTTFFEGNEEESVEKVLNRIEDKIKEKVLLGNYFFIETVSEEGKERCVVRRPVDQFRAAWDTKIIDDNHKIEQLCETDLSSYKNLIDHGGALLADSERKEIRALLAEYLHKSAEIIHQKYKNNVEKRNPLLEEISSIEKEKNGLELSKAKCTAKIQAVRKNLEGLVSGIHLEEGSGDEFITRSKKMHEFGTELKQFQTETENLTKKIEQRTREKSCKEEESKQYAVDMQKRAKETITEKGLSLLDGVEYSALRTKIGLLLSQII